MNILQKKMITLTFIMLSIASTQLKATEADGMIRIKSNHDVSTTLDKLEGVLKKKGMTIFTRVHHSASAKKVGLKLRDTELLIFGNPKIGSLLMQCEQSTAIDLPMKALAYKDEKGQVWLAYNDPKYMAERHHAHNCDKVTTKMSHALANFSKAATQ